MTNIIQQDDSWKTTQPTPTKIGGLTINSTKAFASQGLCMGIYGKQGIGKTTLVADSDKSEYGHPLFIVATDPGLNSVSDMDVAYVRPFTWRELDTVTNDIMGSKNLPYKSISFDNICEWPQMHITMQIGDSADAYPQIQHYGKTTAAILNKIRDLRDFSARSGINVFFVGWESLKEKEGEPTKARFIFPPSLQEQVPGLFDYIGYISLAPDGKTRCLSFEFSKTNDAKIRRNRSVEARTIPANIYYDATKQSPMQDLLATLRGGKEFPAEKYGRPKKDN